MVGGFGIDIQSIPAFTAFPIPLSLDRNIHPSVHIFFIPMYHCWWCFSCRRCYRRMVGPEAAVTAREGEEESGGWMTLTDCCAVQRNRIIVYWKILWLPPPLRRSMPMHKLGAWTNVCSASRNNVQHEIEWSAENSKLDRDRDEEDWVIWF